MKKIKDVLRQFDKCRKERMQGLEKTLYHILNNRKYCQLSLMKKEDVKSILIVRNNKRIGNMYFLIPFVNKVRALYPDAKISMMLNQPWQSEVFKNMGINIFYYSHFSFKNVFSFLHLLKEMRKNVFDLILLPNSSAGDTSICACLSGRNKVSIADHRRDIAFTHTFSVSGNESHMALSSLFLLDKINNVGEYKWNHCLVFSEKEKEEGALAYKRLIRDNTKKVVVYFRGARGDKLLSNDVWNQLLFRISSHASFDIQWIEILSPDIKTPLNEEVTTFSSSDMRHLGCVLHYADAFICCDTGPLHLADAAGARCIGLFNKTDPTVFGLLGENTMTIRDLDHFDAVAVADFIQQ